MILLLYLYLYCTQPRAERSFCTVYVAMMDDSSLTSYEINTRKLISISQFNMRLRCTVNTRTCTSSCACKLTDAYM